MRRNKLLLEHIMHERLQKSLSTINYYKTEQDHNSVLIDKLYQTSPTQIYDTYEKN